MTKKLNTESIANELEGASLFFTGPVTPPARKLAQQSEELADEQAQASPQTETTPIARTELQRPTQSRPSKPEKPTNRDTVIPRHHDTMTPRDHDTTIPMVHGVAIELVRKAVKEFGKEAATHRFTPNEKKEIADLIYTYKSRGVKTSENEIARIAINFIVEDYRENGENSVLHRILEALNE